jgi:hypothetical protein
MDAVPENLKARVEEAMKESVAVAAKGRRFVDHVRARLDFSKDSESSGSRVAAGAAQGGWQTAAEELGEELVEESQEDAEGRGEPTRNLGAGGATERGNAGTGEVAPRYLMEFMRSFGQMRANDDGWPTFDGRYVGYPRFKKEWVAYRLTYHSAVSDDLAARTLRSKRECQALAEGDVFADEEARVGHPGSQGLPPARSAVHDRVSTHIHQRTAQQSPQHLSSQAHQLWSCPGNSEGLSDSY